MAQKTTIMVHNHFKTIATMTLITSILWTAISVYLALTRTPDLEIDPKVLLPVDATYDAETLKNISSRRQISDEPLPVIPVTPPINEIAVAEEASPAPQASPISTPQPETEEVTEEIVEEEVIPEEEVPLEEEPSL